MSHANVIPPLVSVVETRPIVGAHDRVAIVRRRNEAPLHDHPIVFGGQHPERVAPGVVVSAIFAGDAWLPTEKPLTVRTLSGQRSHGEIGSLQELGMFLPEGNRDVFLFPFRFHPEGVHPQLSDETVRGFIAQRIEFINDHLVTEVAVANLLVDRFVSPGDALSNPFHRSVVQLNEVASALAHAAVEDCFEALALGNFQTGFLHHVRRSVPVREHTALTSTPDVARESWPLALSRYVTKYTSFETERAMAAGEAVIQFGGNGVPVDEPTSGSLSKAGRARVRHLVEWLQAAEAIGAEAGAGDFPTFDRDDRLDQVLHGIRMRTRPVHELWQPAMGFGPEVGLGQ